MVLAGEFYPIPFRTRPSKLPAPMVLRPKPRESRSLPVLPRTDVRNPACTYSEDPVNRSVHGVFVCRTQRVRHARKGGETSCIDLQDLRRFPRSKAIARRNGLSIGRTCPNTMSQVGNSCALNGSRRTRPSRGWLTLYPSQNPHPEPFEVFPPAFTGAVDRNA